MSAPDTLTAEKLRVRCDWKLARGEVYPRPIAKSVGGVFPRPVAIIQSPFDLQPRYAVDGRTFDKFDDVTEYFEQERLSALYP